jgi:ubiquitin carboxyl-terminal hydrolase 9/24
MTFLSGNEISLNEWEYLPPVGPRPQKGFVGLKNAGATCYMNSVLQQLFMIEPIRHSILSIEGAADDIEEELSGDEKAENEVSLSLQYLDKYVNPLTAGGLWQSKG